MKRASSSRGRRPLSGLGLAFAVALTIPTTMLSAGPAKAQSSAITFDGEVALSPRLRELTLRTAAMATPTGFVLGANPTGTTKVRILLPAGYDPSGSTRYPVLYLLHGGAGNQTDWTTPASKGKAEELTANLPIIVVMPEGGLSGAYTDWYNGGAFGPPQWKTYHLNQLLPWIDAHYKTIANRTGRAIAGLSMGGGGLRYAQQRPELFGITAGFSGDVDPAQPQGGLRVGPGAFLGTLIWGDFATQEVRWRGISAPEVAKNLSNTDVALYLGDRGAPESTYIAGGNQRLRDRLTALGIPHQYTVYPGLSHSWANWNRALGEWLPRLMQQFQDAQAGKGVPLLPTSFSYSSIDTSYSAFGWTVQMDRSAVEFSALEVADGRTFQVFGSGKAMVQTPSMSAPNIEFKATITNLSNSQLNGSVLLKTNAQGQLVVPVELGTANAFQQFSAQADAASTGNSTDDTPFLTRGNGSRFYRARVTISATPNGLCQAVQSFQTDVATTTLICRLAEAIKSGSTTSREVLVRVLKTAVDRREGKSLTEDQANALIGWANTL